VSVFFPSPPAEPSSFWQEEDDKYGWIHRADPGGKNFRAGVLLIFIHGIFGDSRETWGETPIKAMDAAEIDADAFSFRFPASLTEDADVEDAANHLATALQEKFRRYRHLYFCVHSTGGLVVKAALVREADALLKEIEKRPQDFRFLESAVLRTRRILNLDVPHGGGEYWKSKLGGFVYKWITRPSLHVLRAVRIWPYPVGSNKIVSQLKYKNDWVLNLEKQYNRLVTMLEEQGLPRPVSIEFVSDANAIAQFKDIIIEEHAGKKVPIRSDAEKVPVRGDHSTHKLAKHDTDMIAGLLAKRLHGAVHEQTLALTTQLLALVYDYERALRVHALVGDASSGTVTARGDTVGTQSCIEARVRAFIASGAEKVRSFVVTGDAGVGKSVVVRRLARTLGLHHLNRDNDNAPLPFVVPLQRVKLKPQEVERFNRGIGDGTAWTVLAKDWCAYVNGILERDRVPRKMEPAVESRMPKLKAEWLHRRLMDHPGVIILDGIDEFLSNNLQIGFKEFHGMLRKLQSDYARNTSLTILLGVRSSQGGIETLAGSKNNIFRVRRLETSEADSIYPGAKAWIERIPEKELRDLLLTPLILSQLGPRLGVLAPEKLSSRAAILEAALDSILEKTDLEMPETERERRAIQADQWKDALSLVAWRFHAGFRATMGLERLRLECEAALGRPDEPFAMDRPLTWLRLLNPPPELTQKYELHGERNPAMHRFVENLQLAAHLSTLEVIMRTIFFPTDELTFRFLHRDWQEFLASRYFADCVRYNHADELRDQASTQSMFKMAGERLGDVAIKRDQMAFFLGRSQDLKHHYIIGNFLALINNSVIPAEGPVLGLLFKTFEGIEGIAQFVTLSGLGYRVLNAQLPSDSELRDPTAAAMRAGLIPLLRTLTSAESSKTVLPITALMARCYLIALGEDVSKEPASREIDPALTTRSIENDEASLLLVAIKKDGEFDITTAHRSLQRAFLLIQTTVTENREPARPIAILHYLFLLALARRYNAGIHELNEELPKLLAPNGPLEQEVRRTGVSPLLDLYHICREMVFPEAKTDTGTTNGRS
jgi:pimeloyl-ACP methyl ester carboxylesterase